MTAKDNSDTQNKIIEAARNVFIKKGMNGARMQEIADEAGINKALLHYYFKNKQTLFKAIFEMVFEQMFSNFSVLISTEMDFLDKIREFTNRYIEMLIQNPFLPIFLLNEINHTPDIVAHMSNKIMPNVQMFAQSFQEEVQKGKIRDINFEELIINIIALCIFPIISKNIFKEIFKIQEAEVTQFLENRKKTVPEFIINSIKIK